MPAASADPAALARLLTEARSAVALTGAGISVPSGIPDFRTPGTGMWANVDPMQVAHIDAWRRDPAQFWRFYGDRFQRLRDVEPNGAHRALVELERLGLLRAVVTQNVDRLHGKAGTGEVVEMHGSIDHSSCLACGMVYPLDEVQRRLEAADDGVPPCDCGRPLKPDVVLFGEALPAAAVDRAAALMTEADLVLCVGSSLEVFPVAELPEIVLASGGQVAIVTTGPTHYDGRAAVRLIGDVELELQAVVAAL